MSEEKQKVSHIQEIFEQEFSGFRSKIKDLSLVAAENLQRELIELKTKHTGKKSEIANAKKLIGQVAPEERGAFGQFVQSVEKTIVSALDDAESNLKNYISQAKTERESVDVTLPGRRPRVGHLHPITLLRQKIEDIFVSMGYAIEDDREIETDYYNFDALNIPDGHPARESQDTFYTTKGFALRS
nr:hypothetical protein [Pyrinomonadaceae bacterium]